MSRFTDTTTIRELETLNLIEFTDSRYEATVHGELGSTSSRLTVLR